MKFVRLKCVLLSLSLSLVASIAGAQMSPGSGATNVATSINGSNNIVTGTAVTIAFSQPMDPTTINSNPAGTLLTFTLRETAGNDVPGMVAMNAANTVATFTPTAPALLPNTSYTATVTIAARYAGGAALADAVVWSFTTRALAFTGQAPIGLGTAGTFAILTKTGITDVPASTLNGDVGTSPITGAALLLTCSEVITGMVYTVDAAGPLPCRTTNATLLTAAVGDMGFAYIDAAGRTLPDFTELGTGEIGGLTLVPGLYKWGSSVSISTDVTLSGGPSDVWVFQIAGTLNQANGTRVTLTGGAQPKNIFWQVADVVAIGTTAHFEGVILAQTMIAMNTGASANGRLLAQTAVTLQQNSITQPGAPTNIAGVSGSGQTAVVGVPFARPLVVIVTDSDSNPVSGATVIFAGTAVAFPSGATATTDSNGEAQVFAQPTSIGPFTVTASVVGVSTPATFAETGAGAPTNITAVSGAGQSAAVGTSFASPLVVRVQDALGNPSLGTTVDFAGVGVNFPSGATAVTNSSGLAQVSVIPTSLGALTVTASVAGVSAPANFAEMGLVGAPASLAAVSGSGQSAAVANSFTNALVVIVQDGVGNPVPGVIVTFAGSGVNFPSGATGVTDASGQARVTAMPISIGALTVTAQVVGIGTGASFTETGTAPVFNIHFDISSTRASTNTTPLNTLNRSCCGEHWTNLETARGTYDFTNIDAWTAQAQANGAKPLFTWLRVPTWASKLAITSPPSDLYGSGTANAPVSVDCQNVLTGTTTTDCMYKEFVTKLMQHVCHVSGRPDTPSVGSCDIRNFEAWNEFNGNGYWTGAYQDIAVMSNDMAVIVRAYCGDCTIIAGSVSAGGDGYNPAGGSSHYDAALLDFLTRWGSIPSPSLPDAISYHAYPSRTTVKPAPFPTTTISDSSPLCRTSTPSASCRTAIKDMVANLKGPAVLGNPAISSWAANLKIWMTEGGYGLNAAMADSKNGSLKGDGTTAVFTSFNQLPITWTTGTAIKMESASPSGFNTKSTAITVTGANTFSFPNTTLGTSTAGLATNMDLTNTWLLRQAYISQWMIVLATTGSEQNLGYAWQEPCWMTFMGTNDNSACPNDPKIPVGVTPTQKSWVQTAAWLDQTVFTGPLVSTAAGSNYIWTINMVHNGQLAQLAWYTGWESTTGYKVPEGFHNYQTIDGTVSSIDDTLVLSNRPILIY